MIRENNEYYVSLEVAKLLREIGFDWNCYKVYKTDVTENLTLFTYTKEEGYRNTSEFICSAPTLDVAQRWLREVKDIDVYIFPDTNGKRECVYKVGIKIFGRTSWIPPFTAQYNTYEEAQEAGIKKALEIILKNE